MGIKISVFALFALLIPTHKALAVDWGAVGDTISDLFSGNLGIADYWKNTGTDLLAGVAGDALEGVVSLIFSGAGIFMNTMGSVLDMSINFTIHSSIYKSVSAIQVGWTAVRDFSNLFFIFVLLYIAILTVVGMAGSNAKRWVAHLVIAALLINFSLFATQVVVDAGNVLAIGFWDKMTLKVGGTTANTAAGFFVEGFRINTTFDTLTNTADPTGQKLQLDQSKRIMIYLGGTCVYLIAGYVFLAGAIMMLIRSVTLMVLMIVSPFAFLGFALPKGGGFASQWLNKLIGSTFVAPAFIFMLYIDSLIIRGTASGPELAQITHADKAKMAYAFAGSGPNFPIIFNFVLMIIFLLAALKIADAVSSGAGSAAGSWAKKGLGGGAAAGFTGIAAFGRQTYGAAGKRAMNDKEWVAAQQRLVAKGGMTGRMANIRLATAEKASKGTFDIRNAPMGGLGVTAGLGAAGIRAGTASKRTFETHGQVGSSVTGTYRGTAKEKELIDTAKARFSDDPHAQEAFLKQRGVQLDQYRNKDVKTELDRKKTIEDEKSNIKTNKSAYDTASKNGTLDNASTDPKDEGKTIGEAAAQAIKESMSKLSGKESEKLIKEEAEAAIKDPNYKSLVLAAAGRQHLNYMNTNSADFNPDVMRVTNDHVMAAGGAGAQYLIQQQKMKTGIFPTNLTDAIKSRQRSYQVKMAQLQTLPEGEAKNIKIADFEHEHDTAMQDILGGMSNKDVARLDPSIKTNPTLVRNYTDKHFDEIENYHKNTAKDYDKEPVKAMFGTIREHAKNGNQSSKKYMSSRKKDSAYYDAAVAESASGTKKLFDQAKTAREKAQKDLDEAKASGVVWRRNDAQQKLSAAKDAEKLAKENFDSTASGTSEESYPDDDGSETT